MGSDPLTETDLSGTPSAELIFFNGKRTARLDLPSGTVHYYFSDHLGSASVVTSATGAIQDESDYYPFGGERIITNSDPNQYKFTGKERDVESGLDFFIARYYASNLGRFTSPDEFAGGPVDAYSANDPLPPGPLPYADIANPQSLNKYAYTYNNPLNYVDPDGHLPPPFWILLQNLARSVANSPITQRVGVAAQRWGTAAWNSASRFFNSPGGQQTIQTVGEIATGTQAPTTPSPAAVSGAFERALAGGPHAGMLRNYATKTVDEIGRGIASYGKQLASHEDKITNPSNYVKGWDKLARTNSNR